MKNTKKKLKDGSRDRIVCERKGVLKHAWDDFSSYPYADKETCETILSDLQNKGINTNIVPPAPIYQEKLDKIVGYVKNGARILLVFQDFDLGSFIRKTLVPTYCLTHYKRGQNIDAYQLARFLAKFDKEEDDEDIIPGGYKTLLGSSLVVFKDVIKAPSYIRKYQGGVIRLFDGWINESRIFVATIDRLSDWNDKFEQKFIQQISYNYGAAVGNFFRTVQIISVEMPRTSRPIRVKV